MNMIKIFVFYFYYCLLEYSIVVHTVPVLQGNFYPVVIFIYQCLRKYKFQPIHLCWGEFAFCD